MKTIHRDYCEACGDFNLLANFQRGFARAAIQECLYRLRDMGIRKAYITGYSPEAIALYGSLGATEEQQAYVYKMG